MKVKDSEGPDRADQLEAGHRIPLKEKAAFGCGGVARGLQETIDSMLLSPVFVLGVGISPAIMSLCGLLYRVFDAVTDALMGVITDNTRTKWGRRRPYIVLGSILMACSLPVMFVFDPHWSVTVITFWMIGASLFLYLGQTVYNIPYQAMLLESSPDSHERTRMMAFTAYFGMSVQFLLAWSWKIAQAFQDNDHPIPIQSGALWVTVITAVVVLFLGVFPALFGKERFYAQASHQKKLSLTDNMKLTFKNRKFLILISFIFLSQMGFNLKWTLVFFVRYYHVCGGDDDLAAELTGWGGSVQVISSIIGIAFFRWLSLRIGKLPTVKIIALVIFIVSACLGLFYTPKFPWLSVVPYLIFGAAISSMWVLVPSMLSDVIDDDEIRTGERREGSYASVWSWLIKAALSIAAALSGPLAVWAGYRAEIRDNLPQEVIQNMIILLSVVPALFLGLAYLFIRRFPINEAIIKENAEKLAIIREERALKEQVQ